MGGFDAVVLRSICASYFENHVTPVLRDLEQAHAKLASDVQDLATKLDEKCNAQTAEVQQKAAIEQVPTIGQFATLHAGVQKLEAEVERKFADLAAKPEGQTGPSDVPTMCQFEELVAKVGRKANATFAQLKELTVKVESVEVESRAYCRDVPTLSQVQKLIQTKANTSKVPTMVQFNELCATVEGKVNANLCPTLAQVEELASTVQRSPSAGQLEKLFAELNRKANVVDVATIHQCEQLSHELAQKANISDVPGLDRFDELASTMERKLAFLAAKCNSAAGVCQPVAWFMPSATNGASWETAEATAGQAQFVPVQWPPPMQFCHTDSPPASDGAYTDQLLSRAAASLVSSAPYGVSG